MSIHQTLLASTLAFFAAACSAPSHQPLASQPPGAPALPTPSPSPPSGALRATVVDDTAFPLPGALVWLCPVVTSSTGAQPPHSVTAGNGTALFADIPVGSYLIRSALQGFRQSAPFPEIAVPLTSLVSATVPLRIHFDPGDTVIAEPVIQPLAGPVSMPSPVPSPTPTPFPCAGPA